MKPKSPFTQSFDQLPAQLPIYLLENALLPGGELPLELSEPAQLAMFLRALKTDQLIGLVQAMPAQSGSHSYQTGCAGRIRQYRERKDGRLNVMLTGLCRFRILQQAPQKEGYALATVDWSGFEHDYDTEDVEPAIVEGFKSNLRHYFDRHNMQTDWDTLNKLPIEQVVNNLVLVMHLKTDSKQQLLEAPTLTQRVELFSSLLETKSDPIKAPAPQSNLVN